MLHRLQPAYSLRSLRRGCALVLMVAFCWKTGIDPVLFASRVITHVGVTHGCQFTGSVL